MKTFQRAWQDFGVALTLELATRGNLTIGATRTEIPFASGGPNGRPIGWTAYQNSGGVADTQANFSTSTSGNTFSISAKTMSTGLWYAYGAEYQYAIGNMVGRRFRVSVRVRKMVDKTQTHRYVDGWFVPKGSGYGNRVAFFSQQDATEDWELLVWDTPPVPVGITHLSIGLMAGEYYDAATATWGAQYTDLAVSLLDDTTPSFVWEDLTCDVKAIRTRYGRERFTNRYDVGTMTVELANDDGKYSYANPHPLNLSPGRPVRLTATHAGITYPLAYGVVDGIQDAIGMDGRVTATLTCVDPTTLLATTTSPAFTMPPLGFAGDESGWRIGQILDYLAFVNRDVDDGQFTTAPIRQSGRTLRDEAGITADSEGGNFYAERDGTIMYRDRTWPTVDVNLQEVTANLHANPDEDDTGYIDSTPNRPDAPDVCLTNVATSWSQDRVINDVTLSAAGGTARRYLDADSYRAYGPKSYERMDFVFLAGSSNTKTYLDTRAADLMAGYAQAILRLNSVTYRPTGNPDAWPWTLSVFLNWLVRVWYTNRKHDWGFRVVTHIQSIEHVITPTTWETTMAVDRPTSLFTTPYETGVRTVSVGGVVSDRTVADGSQRTYGMMIPLGTPRAYGEFTYGYGNYGNTL